MDDFESTEDRELRLAWQVAKQAQEELVLCQKRADNLNRQIVEVQQAIGLYEAYFIRNGLKLLTSYKVMSEKDDRVAF